jgi:hypothetical protein
MHHPDNVMSRECALVPCRYLIFEWERGAGNVAFAWSTFVRFAGFAD